MAYALTPSKCLIAHQSCRRRVRQGRSPGPCPAPLQHRPGSPYCPTPPPPAEPPMLAPILPSHLACCGAGHNLRTSASPGKDPKTCIGHQGQPSGLPSTHTCLCTLHQRVQQLRPVWHSALMACVMRTFAVKRHNHHMLVLFCFMTDKLAPTIGPGRHKRMQDETSCGRLPL